jgi:hypothetical protein
MAQFTESGHKTFTSGSTLARYLRVKTPAAVVAAGAADAELGVVTRAVTTSGDPADVLLRTAQGTTPMVASVAINVGDTVYTAADGKIGTETSGTLRIGIALSAATADGDIVEVLRDNTIG